MTTRRKCSMAIILCAILLTGCGTTSNPNVEGTQQPLPTSTILPTAAGSLSPKPATSAVVAPTLPSASILPLPSPSPTAKAQISPKGNLLDVKVDHLVVVVEENHSYKQIMESGSAPYMQSLIKSGALFTNAHGITHPSQPNYLALFSGSTQGITDDACKKPFDAPNLGSELLKAKLSFTGYSGDLPKRGFTGCSSKVYARKHNPWVQFTNVPAELNLPLSDFPQDYSQLPTVSFVIPNVNDDMHDGTIQQADEWLKNQLDGYVKWAEKNNSMLIVTWDEDDFAKDNHIPLIIDGPMIKAGTYDTLVNHYNVLRTIEEMYHLPLLGKSKTAEPMLQMFK